MVKNEPIAGAFTRRCESRMAGCGGAAGTMMLTTDLFCGPACDTCANFEVRIMAESMALQGMYEWTMFGWDGQIDCTLAQAIGAMRMVMGAKNGPDLQWYLPSSFNGGAVELYEDECFRYRIYTESEELLKFVVRWVTR